MILFQGVRVERTSFKERVAIVTGGGSGMGRQIALRSMQEGDLVAIAEINLNEAKKTQRVVDPRMRGP